MATNPTEVDDMRHHSRWIFENLMRLLLPSSGRHRAAIRHRDAPTTHTARLSDAPARLAAAESMN
ncbi:hypothetical protein AB4Z54_57180, partial [Streptomyces sp. MCAF7]